MTEIAEVVRAHYPNAKTGEEVTGTYLGYLEDEFKSDLSKMLFATSLCSDDINVSTDFRKVLSRPFSMGGLGGLPYSGLTGMVAFGHHIPDNGDAFIFYGPHIGITDDGRLGKMIRPGQSKESNSCGALMLALGRMKNQDDTYIPTSLDIDYQQIHLERTLMPYKNEILSSDNEAKAITDYTYSAIHKQICFLVQQAKNELMTDRVFLLGGVIINTSPGLHDFVDIRDFRLINVKNDEPVSSRSILNDDLYKV
jgi:hypothetical protein